MKKLLRQLLFYSALFCYHHAFAQIAYMPSLRGVPSSAPIRIVVTTDKPFIANLRRPREVTFNGSVNYLSPPNPSVAFTIFVYSRLTTSPTVENNEGMVGTSAGGNTITGSVYLLGSSRYYVRAVVRLNNGKTFYGNTEEILTGELYTVTRNKQTYIVPPNITSITIRATGGRGGDAPDVVTKKGGKPAKTEATFAVTPNDVISVYVGSYGDRVPNDVPSTSYKERTTAGGGGASWVFNETQSNKILMVAGGGGGAFSSGTYGYADGADASTSQNGTKGILATGGLPHGSTLLSEGMNGGSGESTKFQLPVEPTTPAANRSSGGGGGGVNDSNNNLSVAKGLSIYEGGTFYGARSSPEGSEYNAFYGGGGYGGGGGGYAFKSESGGNGYYSGCGGGGGGYSGGGTVRLGWDRRGGGSGGGGGSYINPEATQKEPIVVVVLNGDESEVSIIPNE